MSISAAEKSAVALDAERHTHTHTSARAHTPDHLSCARFFNATLYVAHFAAAFPCYRSSKRARKKKIRRAPAPLRDLYCLPCALTFFSELKEREDAAGVHAHTHTYGNEDARAAGIMPTKIGYRIGSVLILLCRALFFFCI